MKSEKFTDQIFIEKGIVPLYQKIRGDKELIFVWGIGALANNFPAYCRKYGIKIQGFFVDVEKKVDLFKGLPVFGLSELIEKYPKFSVIMGHSNYEDGLKHLEGIENISNVYCLASVCCEIYNLITEDFIKNEAETINSMFAELQEDLSRDCLRSYFEARINDNVKYMFPYYQKGTTYWSNDIFELSDGELLLDVGACVGNAILPFVESVQGRYKGIIAVEPDEANFAELKTNLTRCGVDKITLRRECIYDHDGYVSFEGEKEYGRICETAKESRSYPAITIDSLCRELAVEQSLSIIKINFPFSVPEILYGAQNVMRQVKPKLIIRIGFDENVLLNVFKVIREINSQYKIYLRYTLDMPQGLTLFAI